MVDTDNDRRIKLLKGQSVDSNKRYWHTLIGYNYRVKNLRRVNERMKTMQAIYRYREMIFSLVRRELRGRYKASFLGFLWTFVNPFLQLLVYTLVFSVIMRSGIEKYYLFLFVALIPWIFFSSSVSVGATCIVNQSSMVTKIYFPREVLPISFVTSQFVSMLLSFVVVLLVVLLSGLGLVWTLLPMLIPIMLLEYCLALGITLIVSALTVYFRDLEYITGIVVMAWQFMTPVMYSVDMVPENLRGIFMLNPMTSIIRAYRDILYYQQMPEMNTLLLSVGMAIGFLLLGILVFGKLEKRFAEEL